MNQQSSIFVWDSNFITGIESVDAQHHSLVDLFNELSTAITKGTWGDTYAIDGLITNLLEYTEHHFAEEEGLMREAHLWPTHIAAHLQAHAEFIVQVQALAGIRHTLAEHPQSVVEFLIAWLGHHILGMDQTMAGQIHRIARGEAPEQAYQAETEEASRSTKSLLHAIANLYQVVTGLNGHLVSANQQLEQRVADRTAELDLINDQLRLANQRLTVLAQTDGLLGVANRSHFDLVLLSEWQRAIRSEYPVALLLIDVDHFKEFNDTYGHLAGDDCLKAVAAVISACVRRPTDLAARFGGDELAVLLIDTDLNGASNIAQGICEAIYALQISHASSAHRFVTVSIGVAAIVPIPGNKAARMLAAADEALYRAKNGGRNRFVGAR